MGRHGRISWSGWIFRPKGWKDMFDGIEVVFQTQKNRFLIYDRGELWQY